MAKYSKPEARNIIQERIDSYVATDSIDSSRQAYENLRKEIFNIMQKRIVNTILSYSAHKKWNEVDVSSLEKELPGVSFEYVPMEARASFPNAEYDIILVPLYGFNQENYRLGHGGGWYDKLLALYPETPKIGVGLEIGRIDFQTEPHDVLMDIIITDKVGDYPTQ